jgi:hypothetical protein
MYPHLIDDGRGGYDDVRGVIIGGDWVNWQLFYDGRPQGGKEIAANDEEAIEAARAKCAKLKAEWCEFGLYKDASKWEVRLT